MPKVTDQVLRALKQSLAGQPAGARCLLAVSGGLDSMVLLEAAARLRLERVVVLHVNHALRGTESDADEAFVREQASARGFEFLSHRLQWKNEKPGQAACRRLREEFFSRARLAGEKIVYAHHLNDQAETIFLRLLRGTGLDGLAAMAPATPSKIRPFLQLTRAQLAAAAAAWAIAWREDSSNASSAYERNWLRHEIFPLLEERRPGFAGKLAALAEEARLLRQPVASSEILSLEGGFQFALRENLRGMESRELKNLFSLNRLHTGALRALLEKGNGEWKGPGVRFRLSQGILLAERNSAFEDALRWSESGAMSKLGCWQGLPAEAERSRPRGEKWKRAFQEKKIPVFFRDSLPVMESAGRRAILLPGAGAFGFRPTALGSWWLSSLAGSDARADGPSR